jgi:hypothetical protein
MKTSIHTAKAALLTIALLFGCSRASMATSYTASFNGNWSSASSWGGRGPGFNIQNGNNISIPAGVTLVLDGDLIINGDLALNGGTLNLNGQSLTINGDIVTTGLGSIVGNKNSDIAFNGYGGAGNIVFAAGNQVIRSLTINIGSNNGVFLGSDLTVSGELSLIRGTIGIGNSNLIISEKGNVQGGSSSSYVINTGTGNLTMAVPNSGSATMFQVGTQNGYAPVAITNNSATAGNFSVYATEGVLTGGCVGNRMPGDQCMVNTSWNVSSSITTNANYNLEMFWNSDMQINGFNNTQAYLSQFTAGAWSGNEFSTAMVNASGLFSLQMAGATSFSQFAVFGKNAATGINNLTANSSVSLYPNPAVNYINLSLTQTDNYPVLKIFDVAGNEVSSQQIENSHTSLDITSLSSGIYFASLNGVAAQKFIKE